jgi:hypothetical protein
MTGSVTAKADGVVDVSVRGANGLGNHVTGSIVVELARA